MDIQYTQKKIPFLKLRQCGDLARVFCQPFLAMIRFYDVTLSKEIRSRQCRFNPTCSEYAYEAIAKHGFIIGGFLAYKRIKRCNPHHTGGDDPVP